MKDKLLLILAMVAVSLIIVGCWNYEEIGDKAIVTGVAIDYDEKEDKMVLFIEVANPKNMGGNETIIESKVFEGRGENVYDSARDLNRSLGKKLLWSHAKVFIFSERLIKERDKFISVIDVLNRNSQLREDIFLLASMEDKVEEIFLKGKTTDPIISFHIEDIFKNQRSVSRFRSVHLWKFIDDLGDEGATPTIPTIRLQDDGNNKTIDISGTLTFKGIEPVGWLNVDETKAFLYIIDEFKGGIIVVEEEIGGEPVAVSLEIFKNKTDVKAEYEDKLIIKIKAKTEAFLGEISGEVDVIEEKNRLIIEKKAEETIKKRIEELIKKYQQDYNSDIFGFGRKVRKDLPKVWKEIGKNWDDYFRDLEVQVSIDVKIKGSALRSEPIKVGED